MANSELPSVADDQHHHSADSESRQPGLVTVTNIINSDLEPVQNDDGVLLISRDTYEERLKSIRRKETLRDACIKLDILVPKSANLDRLRSALRDYWFNESSQVIQLPTAPYPDFTPVNSPLHSAANPPPDSPHTTTNDGLLMIETQADDEGSLVLQYGIDGAAAEEILGYDDDEELDMDETQFILDAEDDIISDDDDAGGYSSRGPVSGEDFSAFQKRIRIEETKRAEQNRRAGGIKTQNAMVKAWQEFCTHALQAAKIKDEIIDEHHLLLYIRFCSERPKRDRRGKDIPYTFIGASQIKKLYFGALRIRKEQEAHDPTLAIKRPATSVRVWDSLKGRMNEALQRVRDGLVPSEDAPDIVANTFLSAITEEQMKEVGKGFLMHREIRSVINGHLCWNAQNASGNRGDDFRALRLAELQPFTFLHPNKETSVPCVLGLQGEEKAGASRGMRTKVNPVYTVFIAHEDPTRCPLGAFAFYHHFIHDVVDITEALNIDWSVNKSWRAIRVLHSKKSLSTPYHEQSLYNVYVKAFKKAKFMSKIKVHLPRHMLGYSQERMGVDPSITSRMGWTRGETYYDTYAPALPKEAILGAHGFKTHETYDPIWTRVHVPDHFLHLVCPMAEEIHDSVVGRDNLTGAANYWKMIIDLRPYLFQSAAAIFQEAPGSPLFRLPALANADVRNWMANEFPNQLSLLKANAGSPVDMQRIQNAELRRILEDQASQMRGMRAELDSLNRVLQKVYDRTSVLTPTKAFDIQRYSDRYEASMSSKALLPALPVTPVRRQKLATGSQDINYDTGIYEVQEDNGSTGLRAFVNASPKSNQLESPSREKTQVDLVLPPAAAFSDQDGPQLFWPPVLGQRSITWNQIYPLIKQPRLLWDRWRPSKTVNQYSLDEMWVCWTVGEAVYDTGGEVQTGVKPPLRDVECHFTTNMGIGAGWRSGLPEKDRKFWQRFREIPEYIENNSALRKISPLTVLQELKDAQAEDVRLRGSAALATYVKGLREKDATHKPNQHETTVETTETGTEEASNKDTKKRKKPVDTRRNAPKKQRKH